MAKVRTQSGIVTLDSVAEILDHRFMISDIATALTHLNRWNGYVRSYNVAQHSINCVEVLKVLKPYATPLEKLTVFMHDAEEAYLGDIIRPIKFYLNAGFEVTRQAIVEGIRRDLFPAYSQARMEEAEHLAFLVDEAVNLIESRRFFPSTVSHDIISKRQDIATLAEAAKYYVCFDGIDDFIMEHQFLNKYMLLRNQCEAV